MVVLSHTEIYFDIAALAFTLVLLLILKINDGKIKTNPGFGYFLLSVIVALIINICTHCFAYPALGVPVPVCMVMRIMDIMASISVTLSLALYFINSVSSSPRSRLIKKIIIGLYILEFLFQFINFPTMFLYGYTSNGEYYWTPLFMYFVFSLPTVFVILAGVVFFTKMDRLESKRKNALLLVYILNLMGMLAQALSKGRLLFTLPFAALGVFVIYYSMETPDYKKLMEIMDQLRMAEADATKANRAKSDFLANMSHEIRTPMNAVLGMDSLILKELKYPDKSDEEKLKQIGEYAEHIKDAGKLLMNIINDILDLSKIESGKMEIIEQPYHFGKVLADVNNIIELKAEQKGLAYEVKVDDNMKEEFVSDPMRVEQIIINILNNSIKYTDQGSVKLYIKLMDEDNEKATLRIMVSDTGSGIKEEDLTKLFDAFERFNSGQNQYIEGTGLGLTIVKRILTLMDGEISVQSVYGKGSTFIVMIPQKIYSDTTMAQYKVLKAISEQEENKVYIAKECRILLVDDNTVNLVVARNFLDDLRADIDTVTSGKTALEAMRANKYDLIYMDHMMPDIDGMQVRQLSLLDSENKNINTPMVMMTANALGGMKEDYLAAGFIDYLSKPVDRNKLTDITLKYLPKEKVKEL
ncbi:MAG: response regulator [Lachnospiraceae bacterium]|nr:response regulator [Lachnospiraceae bacterium]